jgi:hypothetical protein
MGGCEPGHFGPAACTARRGCGYPEDDSRQPAVHADEAQRAAPRRRERGLARRARPALDLAGACTSCTGCTCTYMRMHRRMHRRMDMRMERTSRGTCMSTDFRLCCDGASSVASVCHQLCGDGGRGRPLKLGLIWC